MELQLNKSELAEFVKLRTGFRCIKDLDDTTIKKECLNVITRSFTYSSPNGQTSELILTTQSNELFNALKGRYKTLTIPEVQKAFKMGLDNEFGAYFGMCGKTYNQFLKAFFELPQRGRQWLDYLDSLDIQTASEPKLISRSKGKAGLIEYFEFYKKHGRFDFFPHIYYDLIKKEKGVKSLITLEQYREIKEKTESEWIAKYTAEKEKAERMGRFNDAEAIGSLLANGIEKDKTLQNRQKELALKVFFDGLDKLEL